MLGRTTHFIDISQLRIGLYVHLDLGWMDHPFMLSNFKLKDETQIEIIRKTGLKKLRYDPKRSDCEPLPEMSEVSDVVTAENTEQEMAEESVKAEVTLSDQPQIKMTRAQQLHHAIDESEKKFVAACDVVRKATQNLHLNPVESIQKTTEIVNEMVDTVLTEGDVAIHALNGNTSKDADYLHPMNVTVLSLMLAKSIEMSEEETRMLAMAAIFHDIGKTELPEKIGNKKEPLTQQEQLHLEKHSEIGARIAKQTGLDARISTIILQHHVYADGSGYPKQLSFAQVDPLAKIIMMVNWFDNMCNPVNWALAKTPHEALAQMFALHRAKFDQSLLKHMIKLLGIYPPGSVVQLSNGVYGVVISVNPGKPLRPFVMLHDPLVSRQAPHIMDLREEPSISITACVRPGQLPSDVLNYLNPRKRLSYYIEADFAQQQDE